MAIYSPWGRRVGHNWVHANTHTRNSVWPEIWAMMEKEFWQTPWGKLGEAPDHHLRAPHFIHRQWGATGFWAETWQVSCSPGHRVQGGQGEPSSSADTLSSMEVDGCAPHTYSGPTYRLRRNSSLSLETRALYSSRSSLGALYPPVVKYPPSNAGDLTDAGLIPGLGRSPGGGHSNPPQYSCLENLMDRGVWRATVHRITKSWTWLKWLSKHAGCL